MHDNSACNGNVNVYGISDLEACYDRNLPNIGGIVEE